MVERERSGGHGQDGGAGVCKMLIWQFLMCVRTEAKLCSLPLKYPQYPHGQIPCMLCEVVEIRRSKFLHSDRF